MFIHLAEEAGFANFAYLQKTAIRKDDQFPTLDELITESIDDCASTRKSGANLFCNYHGNPNGDGNRDGNREKKTSDHWTPTQKRVTGDKYGARSERGFLVGYYNASIWAVWLAPWLNHLRGRRKIRYI